MVTDLVLPTPRLDLVLQTPEDLLAQIERLPPNDRANVSPEWLVRVRQTPPGDPWALGFTVWERASGTAVGSCGFKGPPDREGVVEIAYFIEEPQRGRGFAKEAAQALVSFATSQAPVRVVRAHTREGNGASARVLLHCGFQNLGEVVDPEDGPVCRWETPRSLPGEVNTMGSSHE